MPRLVVAAAILAAPFALAPAAEADVLINAIPKKLACGAPIKPGVWAQHGTTGSRKVIIRVKDRRTGLVWWRRTVTAPFSDWRFWYLPSGMDGQCGRTKVIYDGPGFIAKYRFRFTSEGV